MEAREALGTTEAYDGSSSQWKQHAGKGIKRKISALVTSEADDDTGIEEDNIERDAPPAVDTSSAMQCDQPASSSAATVPPAGADDAHSRLDERLADDYMHYDADEEAARLMGNDGGLDDLDAHGLQRGSVDAGPPPPSVQDAKSCEPGASTNADTARDSTFTQRAIAYLCKDLKQGPRDGAARLEALKARVRKRIHASRDSGESQGTPTADADASTESREQAKRARYIDDYYASYEGKGSSSSGSRAAWSAASPAEQIDPLAAVTGDKRELDDGVQSSSYKRLKADGSGDVQARPASARTPVGGGRRHRDAGLQSPPVGSRKSRRVEESGRSDHGNPGSSDDQPFAVAPARQRGDAEETSRSGTTVHTASQAQGGTHQLLGRPPADGDNFSHNLQSDR